VPSESDRDDDDKPSYKELVEKSYSFMKFTLIKENKLVNLKASTLKQKQRIVTTLPLRN
jgi:hypothetical protein